MSTVNTNSKQWSSATPGYIIFLIDQSGSMGESYAEGKSKAEFTAQVLNRTINELINTNMDGETVKDRVFITLIGYGGRGGVSVDDLKSGYLSSFAENPLRLEAVSRKISDGAGGLVEIDEKVPIFVEPIANGLTPMGDALEFAKRLIERWLSDKPDHPAPVIINVSDGLPYNGKDKSEKQKAIRIADEIMSISCQDGSPLIFNTHIGDGNAPECSFEESDEVLYDEQAKFLFRISSVIPDSYKNAALKQDFSLKNNSRGFISNAKPETFIKFINFGSSGGIDKIG